MPVSKQSYKGYLIKLVYHDCRGGGFQIQKLHKGKVFTLLERNFVFIKPQIAEDRACKFIDEQEERLKDKFKVLFIDFCNRVAAKPQAYASEKNIDIGYYLRMHKKLQ